MTENTGNSNAVINLDGAQNDVPHLHSVYLQPHTPQPGNVAPKGGNFLRPQSASFPFTLDGKVICKLFFTNTRCHYKDAILFFASVLTARISSAALSSDTCINQEAMRS